MLLFSEVLGEVFQYIVCLSYLRDNILLSDKKISNEKAFEHTKNYVHNKKQKKQKKEKIYKKITKCVKKKNT